MKLFRIVPALLCAGLIATTSFGENAPPAPTPALPPTSPAAIKAIDQYQAIQKSALDVFHRSMAIAYKRLSADLDIASAFAKRKGDTDEVSRIEAVKKSAENAFQEDQKNTNPQPFENVAEIRKLLTEHLWYYTVLGKNSHVMELGSDGKISRGNGPYEARWELARNGELEFLGTSGNVVSLFAYNHGMWAGKWVSHGHEYVTLIVVPADAVKNLPDE